MEQDRYRAITYKARRLAYQKGFDNDADDIAQEAAFKIHQNSKAIVAFAFVDYLRSNYGRVYEGQLTLKSIERHNYEDLKEADKMTDSHDKGDIDFKRFQDLLEKESRAIFTLKYKWGLTESEIGDCFGVSESRISQLLKIITTKIKAYAKEV